MVRGNFLQVFFNGNNTTVKVIPVETNMYVRNVCMYVYMSCMYVSMYVCMLECHLARDKQWVCTYKLCVCERVSMYVSLLVCFF